MSETMRIRLGLKTHKGALGAENEDRFLIGMDPASNDWLYSPEEISVGEFGTLILLADGLRESGHGSKAANLVCQTIKKLFDEMLEIPPDEEGLISLLRKFFIIANQQLILKTQENPEIRGFGCSASMVLIKDDKAYIVWAGNCRVYRYSKKGVAGSYFCKADRLEQLNVDHQLGIEKKLLPKKTWPDDLSEDQLTVHFGMTHEQFSPGATVVQLHAEEKIMICTEGLFGSLEDLELEESLSQEATPDVYSEDLISKAFNANARESISVIIAVMLNGPVSSPIQRKEPTELKLKAISLLGHNISEDVLISETNQDHSSGIEPGTKDFQSDIKPMKVRTVLPDGGEHADQEQFFAPTAKKEPKPEEPLHSRDKISKISAIENALKKEQLLRKLTPGAKKEKLPEQEDLQVSKSKPRIMATAYPDPVDQNDAKSNDPKVLPDDVEKQTVPKPAEHTDDSDEVSDVPPNMHSENNAGNQGVESIEEEEEDLKDDYIGEEEPGDPFVAELPYEEEKDEISEEQEEELGKEEISTGDLAEYLPDPIARELPIEEDIESGSENLAEEKESKADLRDTEVEEKEEAESEVEPYLSDNPDEDLVIPSIYADEMGSPEDSFQSDEDKETQEDQGEQVVATPSSQEPDRTTGGSPSTQKSNVTQSSTIEHGSLSSKGNDDTPLSRGPKGTIAGLGIRIGIVLIAILLLGMFICNQMGSDNIEDLGLDRVDDRTTKAVPDNQSKRNPTAEEDTPQEEITADIERETVIEQPVEKPVEEKKEEKPKVVEKDKEPERLIKEPDYDDRIKENKQQLTDEVESLLKQKNALCRQINTYQNNAPSKKQDKIKNLVYDCDQLEKKFISIYDSRSGFFKTVRYDLLNSTINNIKFSIEQTEKKFEGVRSEQ